MVYYGYGNPMCPHRRKDGHSQFQIVMVRAYVREGRTRRWIPIGWWCLDCHLFLDEAAAAKAEKY